MISFRVVSISTFVACQKKDLVTSQHAHLCLLLHVFIRASAPAHTQSKPINVDQSIITGAIGMCSALTLIYSAL